jgi:hypothetical protein
MNHPEIKSLYKYKPINQFTLDIIANDRIFYPLPESFNDPFDTKCSFRNKSALTQSTNAQKIARAFPDENPSDILVFTRTDLTPKIDVFNNMLKNFGILSLAEDAKNILMWSHYAEDHKGICIEFERNEVNGLGDSGKTKKVNYTKNYPSLSSKTLLSKKDTESSLMRVLYTKSESWGYEQEWRMFMPKGNTVYSVPGRVKSIIFGARASNMDIDTIEKLIKNKNVVLKKAVLKESEFGIKLEKLIR